jgi:hypothetical protein
MVDTLDILSRRGKRDIHVSVINSILFGIHVTLNSFTAAELTWNHWTEVVEPVPAPAPKFTLRPMWQRAAAVTGQVAIGSYLAFMILVGRTRIIQKLWILPSSGALDTSPKEKRVFMQCVHHFKRQGQLYPYRACKLQETRPQDKEILVKIDGVRGFYSLALEGARINGQEWASGGKGVQMKWAREELIDAWRAEGGAKRRHRPRFVSGPAAG